MGASDITNRRAGFSNYGECVDVYAPGVEITSAGIADDTAFDIHNGTSMAAPHVTGLVALYLETHPDATPAEVHAAVVENSTPDAVSDVPSGTNNLAYAHWVTPEFTPPVPPDLNLRVYGIVNGGRSHNYLVWDPSDSPYYVEIYKNGVFERNAPNNGQLELSEKRNSKDVYQVCEHFYENCSEEVMVTYDVGDFKPNIPPTASFEYTINGMEVSFTDTSTDEDGSIEQWRWILGDGSRDAEVQHPIHTYSQPGTYEVVLFAFDNNGEQNYYIQHITITGEGVEAPPTAYYGYTANGLSLQFEDRSWDNGGSIVSWLWEFGDGSTSELQHPEHTYAAAGKYPVRLTVTDNSGETDSYYWEISVEEAAPDPEPDPDPDPVPISLSASGSKLKGKWQADLEWTTQGISGQVDIYRDGSLIATVDNSGHYKDATNRKGGGTLTYKVCEAGSNTTCSNEVRVHF